MNSLRFANRVLPLPKSAGGLRVLAAQEPAPLDDAVQALRDRLRRPAAGPPLAEFLGDSRHIALVLPDATRPMPVELVEAVLEELGSRARYVLVANGTHRRTTEAERRALVGRFWGKVEVLDRSSEDAGAHRASAGGAGRLDARALEAERLVLMGPVSFHYLAGYGGGGKLVAPGLADRATAERVHSACLAPGGGRHPLARAGVLDGNPLRERIESLCQRAPPQFYVIPLLDSSGRVVELFCGERRGAFQAACGALRVGYGVETGRCSTVIVGGGGRPYDLDFVQAHKALETAAAACRPGGTIVFAASCAEGLPQRHRDFLAAHPTASAMESALRERFDIAGHTVWAAREKAERFRVLAVTELDPALVRALGMEPLADLESALARCDLSDAALLPFGARFLPIT